MLGDVSSGKIIGNIIFVRMILNKIFKLKYLSFDSNIGELRNFIKLNKFFLEFLKKTDIQSKKNVIV